MTINNDCTQGCGPSETARAQGAPTTVSHTPPGQRVDGAEGDSVHISGISAQLADANAVDGRQRADRVTALAAIYGRGEYQVNAADLSRSLVLHAAGIGGSKS